LIHLTGFLNPKRPKYAHFRSSDESKEKRWFYLTFQSASDHKIRLKTMRGKGPEE